jgi:hypothetical protein
LPRLIPNGFFNFIVMPAQAGISRGGRRCPAPEIPASAGMTGRKAGAETSRLVKANLLSSDRMKTILLPLALTPLLSGCIVHTAYNVATAPVRATAWTADKLTTSQAEADRNRGRRERKAEERQAREDRKAAREQRKQQEEATRRQAAYRQGGREPY